MKLLTEKTEIRKLLRPVVWDYHIDPYELYETAIGEKTQIGSFTQQKALIRMLEYLSWYDLLRLFGIDGLRKLITKDIISGLRIREAREKYELVRKVLQGEPVSFSGWSPEYREQIKHSLLSDRWYRSQQRVFSAPVF